MATTSPIWEEMFRTRESWNRYPSEDLIRFFAGNFYQVKERAAVKILEIGCGPGGGSGLFVAREGFSYWGIDGSPTAIEKAKAVFAAQNLSGEFKAGIIQDLPYADHLFDCVIDVACLQHNSEEDARTSIHEVFRVLKPGGLHFSLTAKHGSWGDGTGRKYDATTRVDVTEGPYVGMDRIRFATLESLTELYNRFSDLRIEYSVRSTGDRAHEIGHWFVSARKN